MIPTISQATTMASAFEADLDAFARAGWSSIELWLTKLETFVEAHGAAEARRRLEDAGLSPIAAAAQGGLLGDAPGPHADQYDRRLDLLASLGVPTLVIVPDLLGPPDGASIGRAIDGLSDAAARAASRGVRLALEPRRAACLGASLDTVAAIVAQVGAPNLGICLDVFHYYTGPSKFEDIGHLGPANLFHVQLCDVAGTPRELAGDSDRVLPGDGDFALVPWLAQLARQGYEGPVSLEVLNPNLWAVPADRVAEIGLQALERVLAAAREGR
jgi:sugar phosphate isomerase/epimerase